MAILLQPGRCPLCSWNCTGASPPAPGPEPPASHRIYPSLPSTGTLLAHLTSPPQPTSLPSHPAWLRLPVSQNLWASGPPADLAGSRLSQQSSLFQKLRPNSTRCSPGRLSAPTWKPFSTHPPQALGTAVPTTLLSMWLTLLHLQVFTQTSHHAPTK